MAWLRSRCVRPRHALSRAWLFACALLASPLLAGAATAGAASDLWITPLDPQWNWIEELARRGVLRGTLATGTLAFDRDVLERALLDVEVSGPAGTLVRAWSEDRILPPGLGAGLRPSLRVIGLTTDPERQLRPDFLDVGEGDRVDPALRYRTSIVGRVRLTSRLTAGANFTFDSRGDNDPLNRTRDFVQLDASNNFDAAWVRADFESGAVTLGRVPMGWGPERLGGLLLSPTAPAPDLIHGVLRWGPHRLQAFVGQLSTATIDGVAERRWLYGHRADLFFVDRRLRLSLSETTVVSGPGESLNLRYLNPVPLWAQVQAETSGDDPTQGNVIDMIDGEYVHGMGDWNARWYGSLAVDDVQIHPDGRDRNPDQLAWSAGLDLSRRAWLAGYEYRRIGTWTYLHRGDGTEHSTYYRPLGAPEGPDTDRHHLRVDWWAGQRTRVWVAGERRRRGENRITTEERRTGNAGLPFPRGTVEKRWIGAVGTEFTLPPSKWVDARASVRAALHAITDVNNVAGRDEDVWEILFVLDLRAPALRYAIDAGPAD